MRTKRDQKIPQNLEDYVHSIKNTKNKNKTSVSARKTNLDGNLKDNFPPISVQDKVDDLGDIKDCLDQDIGDNGNSNVDDKNSTNRSVGCVSEPVCQDKVDKIVENEIDVNEGSTRGVWNIKFDDIVKTNKIDSKLVEISTEINKNGNEVEVLNDEMIESGCEKWKYTICGFFVGVQVTYGEARYHLRRMWNRFWYIDLMKNDGGMFFFKFQDEKGMKEVINNRPCLGKPVIMDEMTARMCAKREGRLNFARVLTEVEAKKELKKEIGWFKEKETQGINVEQSTNNKMGDADRPFTEVQNKKVNCEKGKENKKYYKGNRFNGYSNNHRNEIRRNSSTMDNVDKANEIHDDNVDKANRKSTVDESNMKCNKEKIYSSVMKASTSNRFTFLNELVGDEELIPSVKERKIVDEYINKENEGDKIDSQGWSKEMKRYYKDKKELFDAAKEIEIEKEMKEVIQNLEEEFGVKDEISRGMRISLSNFFLLIRLFRIRGMSTVDKQKEVRNLMNEENFQLCGIVETHVKYSKILKIGKKVFGNWDFISNREDNNQGCRIMVGWNPNKLIVWIIAKTKQLEEHSNGSSALTNEMNELLDYTREIEVEDILSSGFHFTWTKSRGNPKCKTLKKLDRIMTNEAFMEKFPSSHGVFLPYLIFDHSHVVLKMPNGMEKRRKAFSDEADRMCRGISEVEVKNAMFDIDDSKAPGLDGFTARFYKSAWSVIGKGVSKAIQEFFITRKRLGEGYNRKQKFKRVSFKIDLQFAYDTIDWGFLKVVLEQFGFLGKMVEWIMVCVSTTKFSININREMKGYFSGGRGLRQDDLISPYLFTLVMEVFSIIMGRNIGLTIAEQSIILDIIPFAIGSLPVRYLGVPQITKKICATDCKPLIDKVKSRNTAGALCEIVSTREMYDAGMSINTAVAELTIINKVVYFIWQERNKRIFKGERRDVNSLVQIIKEVIRLKLVGMEAKESKTIREVEERWSV
nr:hypothetical protein [Tanacetum cinerariifolium]